jgi:hypothetical protein
MNLQHLRLNRNITHFHSRIELCLRNHCIKYRASHIEVTKAEVVAENLALYTNTLKQ